MKFGGMTEEQVEQALAEAAELARKVGRAQARLRCWLDGRRAAGPREDRTTLEELCVEFLPGDPRVALPVKVRQSRPVPAGRPPEGPGSPAGPVPLQAAALLRESAGKVCGRCRRPVDLSDPSWRWTGFRFQHHCPDLDAQGGHVDAEEAGCG